MLLSGAVAGLVGMPAAARRRALHTARPSRPGSASPGIAVALLGRNHPVGIALGALLFAFLDEQSEPAADPGRHLAGDRARSCRASIVLSVVVAYEVVRRYRIALEQRRA